MKNNSKNINDINDTFNSNQFNSYYIKALYALNNKNIFVGLNILLNIFSQKSFLDLFKFLEKKQKIEILYILKNKNYFFMNMYLTTKNNIINDMKKIFIIILIKKKKNYFVILLKCLKT